MLGLPCQNFTRKQKTNQQTNKQEKTKNKKKKKHLVFSAISEFHNMRNMEYAYLTLDEI